MGATVALTQHVGKPLRAATAQTPAGGGAASAGNALNKKRRWNRGVFSSRAGRNYFETDFLNMRSIFSLVASHEACAAWAADSAWLAVLCAPLAAVAA